MKVIDRTEVKKLIKRIIQQTFPWVDKVKGRHMFEEDLNISDYELAELKSSLIRTFNIDIKKKEIVNCWDVDDLIDLVFAKINSDENAVKLYHIPIIVQNEVEVIFNKLVEMDEIERNKKLTNIEAFIPLIKSVDLPNMNNEDFLLLVFNMFKKRFSIA